MTKSEILVSPYDFKWEFPREETLVHYLLNRVSKACKNGRGHVKFVENPESGHGYHVSEVESLSRRMASALARRGMTNGDVVLYSSHEASIYLVMLGVWRANGVMRAIYPEENAVTMGQRIIESRVKWFLVDPETVAEAKKAVESVPWPVEIIVSSKIIEDSGQSGTLTSEVNFEGCTFLHNFFEDDGQGLPELSVGGEDPALILSTSGTTGPTKGCVYGHSLCLKILEIRRGCLFGGQSKPENPENEGKSENFDPTTSFDLLVASRPTHVSAFAIGLFMMADARPFLLFRKVTKTAIFQAVQQYKPSVIYGFPTHMLQLANDQEAAGYDMTSLKYIVTGGIVISPSFNEVIKEKLKATVVIVYGMTESALLTCTRNLAIQSDDHDSDGVLWPNIPAGSVGKLLPEVELMVRSLDDGKILGPNQYGELYFKSPAMFTGYLNNPQETLNTFGDDGFIKTGDSGYFDLNGFVFVVSRSKDCFKFQGNHIVPSEVENVILGHPAVASVSVVGVPDPLVDGETIPRAFVTLKKDVQMQVTAQDIQNFSDDNLASYKRLRGGLFILKELPLGKTGKVDTEFLKALKVPVKT